MFFQVTTNTQNHQAHSFAKQYPDILVTTNRPVQVTNNVIQTPFRNDMHDSI